MYIHVYTMKIEIDRGVVRLTGKVEWATTKTIKEIGNGAKIDSLKKFIGREALVIILKNKGGKK